MHRLLSLSGRIVLPGKFHLLGIKVRLNITVNPLQDHIIQTIQVCTCLILAACRHTLVHPASNISSGLFIRPLCFLFCLFHNRVTAPTDYLLSQEVNHAGAATANTAFHDFLNSFKSFWVDDALMGPRYDDPL